MIELDHTSRRQWFRVGEAVSVRIARPVSGDSTVTCVIPGHHQPGEELLAEQLEAEDDPLAFDYRGNCAYAAPFAYEGQG